MAINPLNVVQFISEELLKGPVKSTPLNSKEIGLGLDILGNFQGYHGLVFRTY